MRSRPLTLSALLLVTAAAAPAQEAVLLRIGGIPGRPVHSRVVMTMFMRGGPFAAMGADTSVPTMRIQMSLTQTLDSAIGDTLVFTVVADSVNAESPAMPSLSEMMQSATAAAPKRSTTRMDTRGRVLAMDLGRAAGSEASAGLPFGGPEGAFGRSGTPYSLPDHPVRVGETWTSTANVTGLPGGSSMTGHTDYRLERIDPQGSAGTAVISMRGILSMPIAGEVTEMPLAGVLRFDIAAGRVTASSGVTSYAVTSPMGVLRGRTEMTQAEDGETAPALPEPPVPTPAIPSKPAAPPAPGSPPPVPPQGR